jgi:hypothetical protein
MVLGNPYCLIGQLIESAGIAKNKYGLAIAFAKKKN